jgi:hypothetical protein
MPGRRVHWRAGTDGLAVRLFIFEKRASSDGYCRSEPFFLRAGCIYAVVTRRPGRVPGRFVLPPCWNLTKYLTTSEGVRSRSGGRGAVAATQAFARTGFPDAPR